MPYWTIRAELDDAPGRLAGLSGAIAACGGNIVAVDVHPLGRNAVADELVVEAADLDEAALVEVVTSAGGTNVAVTPSDPHDLVDAQTRSLRLLHGLSLAAGRRDAALEGALTVLLRADRCCLLPDSAAGLSYLAERALAEGLPVAGTERAGRAGDPRGQVLAVPWRETGGAVRLALVTRAAPPFTDIEGARARGFLMVAAAVAPRESDRVDLLLPNGTEVRIRSSSALDGDGIAALQRSAGVRTPALPGLRAAGTPDAHVVVAETAGALVGACGYERRGDGWQAEYGVSVDRGSDPRALGAAMLRRLAQVAGRAGLEALTAQVGVRDLRLSAARASGLPVTVSRRWGRGIVRIGLLQPATDVAIGDRMPARSAPAGQRTTG